MLKRLCLHALLAGHVVHAQKGLLAVLKGPPYYDDRKRSVMKSAGSRVEKESLGRAGTTEGVDVRRFYDRLRKIISQNRGSIILLILLPPPIHTYIHARTHARTHASTHARTRTYKPKKL